MLLADQGYDADWIRALVTKRRAWANIPPKSNRTDPMIFVLWGKPAQAKKKRIDAGKHVVFEAAHPSPLSAHSGFFGSKPFSKINQTLQSWGQTPIDWQIP